MYIQAPLYQEEARVLPGEHIMLLLAEGIRYMYIRLLQATVIFRIQLEEPESLLIAEQVICWDYHRQMPALRQKQGAQFIEPLPVPATVLFPKMISFIQW